jgi:hypothetical protein
VDEIQSNIGAGRVPLVLVLNAARMLGNPGNADWAMREFRDDVILHNNLDCIRLPAIRAYVDRKGTQLLEATSVMPTVWV